MRITHPIWPDGRPLRVGDSIAARGKPSGWSPGHVRHGIVVVGLFSTGRFCPYRIDMLGAEEPTHLAGILRRHVASRRREPTWRDGLALRLGDTTSDGQYVSGFVWRPPIAGQAGGTYLVELRPTPAMTRAAAPCLIDEASLPSFQERSRGMPVVIAAGLAV